MEKQRIKAHSLVCKLQRGRGVCQSFGMGLGRIDKLQLLTRTCTKPTQGAQCIVGTFLVLGQETNNLGLTRFTTARTQGKPPPSPLQYTLRLSTGATSKWLFVPRLPCGSPEIPTIGIPMTLGAHNFACKPLIAMQSKAKLQPSSRVFQWYVARCLHGRKSNRFLTFSGRESNYQFDSRFCF